MRVSTRSSDTAGAIDERRLISELIKRSRQDGLL